MEIYLVLLIICVFSQGHGLSHYLDEETALRLLLLKKLRQLEHDFPGTDVATTAESVVSASSTTGGSSESPTTRGTSEPPRHELSHDLDDETALRLLILQKLRQLEHDFPGRDVATTVSASSGGESESTSSGSSKPPSTTSSDGESASTSSGSSELPSTTSSGGESASTISGSSEPHSTASSGGESASTSSGSSEPPTTASSGGESASHNNIAPHNDAGKDSSHDIDGHSSELPSTASSGGESASTSSGSIEPPSTTSSGGESASTSSGSIEPPSTTSSGGESASTSSGSSEPPSTTSSGGESTTPSSGSSEPPNTASMAHIDDMQDDLDATTSSGSSEPPSTASSGGESASTSSGSSEPPSTTSSGIESTSTSSGSSEPPSTASSGGQSESTSSGSSEPPSTTISGIESTSTSSGSSEPHSTASSGGQSASTSSGSSEPHSTASSGGQSESTSSGSSEPHSTASSGGQSESTSSGSSEPHSNAGHEPSTTPTDLGVQVGEWHQVYTSSNFDFLVNMLDSYFMNPIPINTNITDLFTFDVDAACGNWADFNDTLAVLTDPEILAFTYTEKITSLVLKERMRCPATLLDIITINVLTNEMKLMFQDEEALLIDNLETCLSKFPTTKVNSYLAATQIASQTHSRVFDDSVHYIMGTGLQDVSAFSRRFFESVKKMFQTFVGCAGYDLFDRFKEVLMEELYHPDMPVQCPTSASTMQKYIDSVYEFTHGVQNIETAAICMEIREYIEHFDPYGMSMAGPIQWPLYTVVVKDLCGCIIDYTKVVMSTIKEFDSLIMERDKDGLTDLFKSQLSDPELKLLVGVLEHLKWTPINPDDDDSKIPDDKVLSVEDLKNLMGDMQMADGSGGITFGDFKKLKQLLSEDDGQRR